MRRKKIFKHRVPPFNAFPHLISRAFALILRHACLVTSRKIINTMLFLKWATRKRDKTFRRFWFRASSLTPLSKHVQNSRMGKGKGKFKTWVCFITNNVVVFEMAQLRWGRFKFFAKQIIRRLTPHVIRINTMHHLPTLFIA